jgi:hypothetical protein
VPAAQSGTLLFGAPREPGEFRFCYLTTPEGHAGGSGQRMDREGPALDAAHASTTPLAPERMHTAGETPPFYVKRRPADKAAPRVFLCRYPPLILLLLLLCLCRYPLPSWNATVILLHECKT